MTLDGYDPERAVGYEYIASEEQGTDLSTEELVALQECDGIFTATGGSLDQLQKQAEAFLAAVSHDEETPDR